MIIILDFGSQYTQLIARRIREFKIYCEIQPYSYNIQPSTITDLEGIILSGGPSSVYEKGAPHCDKKIFELGVPVLGICYGMQLMGEVLDGKVVRAPKREYGLTEFHLSGKVNPLFAGLKKKFIVWMSHGDIVKDLPPGFVNLGKTKSSIHASMMNPKQKLYAVQFHPEVKHTPLGKQILSNFLFNICNCKSNWTMKSFIKNQIEEIKDQVNQETAVCALSGGVDSSVVAVLVHQAIGKLLTCIFVDNGLLRKGEKERVKKIFGKTFGNKLVIYDARKRFLDKLAGVTDPERKRKIIGHEFIAVFEEVAKRIKGTRFLVQGTLYPDVIESVSVRGPSATIKTHHNVGGLPEKMNLKLIEPLRYLFKDEVRELGKELGLPREILWRHPFPGPGLAVRIIGEITEQRLSVLREADAIVEEEILKSGLYETIWQAFAVLLPVKSVGVMGDARTYENVVALRIVESTDAMTADWAKIPYNVLAKMSNRIINEVKGVNRVVYDISQKPPATIEWE